MCLLKTFVDSIVYVRPFSFVRFTWVEEQNFCFTSGKVANLSIENRISQTSFQTSFVRDREQVKNVATVANGPWELTTLALLVHVDCHFTLRVTSRLWIKTPSLHLEGKMGTTHPE